MRPRSSDAVIEQIKILSNIWLAPIMA